MTPPSLYKAPRYPKTHLLAASGIAAVLSLALLVFPSSEVEAKRTSLDLLGESDHFLQDSDEARASEVTETGPPFARAGQTDSNDSAGTGAKSKNDIANAQNPASNDPTHKTITVGKGDTLAELFAKAGLGNALVHEILASTKQARVLTQLSIGQQLEFTLDEQGQFKQLSTRLNALEVLEISKTDKGFVFNHQQIKPEIQTAYAGGVITSSLFASTQKAGLSHGLTLDLANIFGYDIDFAQDLREGDRFELLYEQKTVEGKTVGSGAILAARFTNRGKTYSAVRYTNRQGNSSYYNEKGDSLRKAFIRTPIDFARISSNFSLGRKHPILNTIRAHKGVDYAAPRGTPIKAAGDGKVLLAGRKGGYGNAIVLQHGNNYRTLYGHMQGFAKGIKNGVSVRQGQVIGYVGTTGLSTGPHLHYEFIAGGVNVDPLKQKGMMADPINAGERQRFLSLSKPLMARLEQEKNTLLAANKR